MTPAEEFAEFVEFIFPRLRRTAFLLCGDWHTAEDLAQTALTKVFVSWRRIQRQDAVHAYTHRTLVNVYLAHRRLKVHAGLTAPLPQALATLADINSAVRRATTGSAARPARSAVPAGPVT